MSTTLDGNAITVYLTSNRKHFGMTIDKSITVRDFTRAIQHNSTFGISKANLRLKLLQDDGTWTKFYCRRWQSNFDRSLYDEPISMLGVVNDSMFQVEWVLSKSNMVFLAIGAYTALPLAVAGSVATYGAVSGSFCVGYLFGAVAFKATMQVAFAKARVIMLAPDMPPGILEIRQMDGTV